MLDVAGDEGAEEDVLAKGTSVGRYTVLERLGAGGMGVVYAAYDPELDRKIALKFLRAQQGTAAEKAHRQERLVREAKAIAKLSHANVVGIFEIGVHEGRVFLAMEYLGGGTLRDWMSAKKRPWREIVKMFVEVGQGLAAAHAEGLIHRDFKPDNVLIDKAGKPKVADFGLVRLGSAETDGSGPVEADAPIEVSQAAPVPLTRTGALAGTPAYMAPEQFLGRAIDARTDQFAFCVALYEALYGERPFVGETVMALAGAVTRGRVRETAKDAQAPAWVRRALVRGLSTEPDQRFAGFSELNAVLASDPIVTRRRRLAAVGAAAVLVAGVLIARHYFLAKRHEIDRRVAEHVHAADALLGDGEAKRVESNTLRERAFAAFDGYERETGEDLWAQSIAAAKQADAGYQRGIQRLEAAATLTPRRDLKDRIADALAVLIGMVGHTDSERDATMKRLAVFDESGARAIRLNAPARLQVETIPPGLAARIESYDPLTRRRVEVARPAGRLPVSLELAAGSYRLTFEENATHVGFDYPVLLAPGEIHRVSVPVPARTAVPRDFVYVPAGRFLFGSANEELRTTFLGTVPLHSVETGAFLIAKYETTFRDWIAFLETLPDQEREARRPHGRRDVQGGFVDVKKGPERWEIQLRVTDRIYRAKEGEPLRYADRKQRASQDWSLFPVTGISAEDALQYVAWLDRSGRVPGARLCTEREWERAARGADGREFPHGNEVSPDDANFDLTYRRKSGAFGSDEVGSHPASLSPFSVFDIGGNAWEVTASVLDKGLFVIRGGSFYQGSPAMRTSNRETISAVTRDHTVGIRVCATVRF